MTLILLLVFVVSFAVVFYTYLGYGFLLYALVLIKRKYGKKKGLVLETKFEPEVTLLIAAYNEEACIAEKIVNSLSLDYPADKLNILFVTDGSDDATVDIIEGYPGVSLMHEDTRAGKIAAVQRVMPSIKSPIVIFTDANTELNKEVIRNIVRHYANPKVGAVAGEKRIMVKAKDAANAAGEGIYWKYESMLKRWDSELYSVVGAAGELFSIRTSLHQDIPQDTLIEDFVTTMQIAAEGYVVRYEPEAYASEGPSASIKEELKRKVRIAAGGIQAVVRLRRLLNPFKFGILSFQYFSHRVLRWTLAPLGLLFMFLSNIWLAVEASAIWEGVMVLQVAFYVAALLGWVLERKQMKVKAFFVPYYFCVMNFAMYRGFFRYLKGQQSVLWERAQRA